MLMPKKVKYRKVQRGRMKGKAWRGSSIAFGEYGTKKPSETRMGKGKGAPEEWVAVIRPGKILFEMEGVGLDIAQQAMRLAAHKIPMKTKFISRESAE